MNRSCDITLPEPLAPWLTRRSIACTAATDPRTIDVSRRATAHA